MVILWQMYGVIGINCQQDSSSLNSKKFSQNLFISSNLTKSNDGCSSMVECTVVVRKTRVRFSPSILSQRFFNDDLLKIRW